MTPYKNGKLFIYRIFHSLILTCIHLGSSAAKLFQRNHALLYHSFKFNAQVLLPLIFLSPTCSHSSFSAFSSVCYWHAVAQPQLVLPTSICHYSINSRIHKLQYHVHNLSCYFSYWQFHLAFQIRQFSFFSPSHFYPFNPNTNHIHILC